MVLMTTVSPDKFGVSFSIKQCRNFGTDAQDCLRWLLHDAGFRRFRLMSYWNEHEKEQGKHDFRELDWQVAMIAKAGGEITMCLGARQPRWPENHWPEWVWRATKPERTEALLAYIQTVVERYKDNPAIVSWQLENEALLKSFGKNAEIDRRRLRQEYYLVRSLDPPRPIIMSTSNGWGVPIRRPRPHAVGFSYYPTMFMRGRYTKTVQKPWLHRTRKGFIQKILRRPVFIHELQLEPWGPTAIWKMPVSEQDKSMSPAHIAKNLRLARKINAYPVDLWGGEWWYWRLTKHNDPSIWQTVKKGICNAQ